MCRQADKRPSSSAAFPSKLRGYEQKPEGTDAQRWSGRSGQVSEPIIAKPSSFIRSGKSGACAAKATRLMPGGTAALFELPLGMCHWSGSSTQSATGGAGRSVVRICQKSLLKGRALRGEHAA